MSKQLFDDSLLSGSNAAFIEAIYEEYLHNPNSVAVAWRDYFEQLAKSQAAESAQPLIAPVAIAGVAATAAKKGEVESHPVLSDVIPADSTERKQVALLQLINMYRYLGLSLARLDRLGLLEHTVVSEFIPALLGLTEQDMD